jgi:hypothetical protein
MRELHNTDIISNNLTFRILEREFEEEETDEGKLSSRKGKRRNKLSKKKNSGDLLIKEQLKVNVIKRGMLLLVAVRLLPDNKYSDYSKIFKILDSRADGFLDINVS